MRSVYLDTEMMLFIESRELNETLREQAENLKLASRWVAPDGAIIDGENYRKEKQGTGKICRKGRLPFIWISEAAVRFA